MNRKVALFVPCFVDQVLPQAAVDALTVLRRIGCEVIFPEDQTCCGQPAFNSGHWGEARPCAERFVRVFGGFECVVAPSGSCVSMVRTHYPDLLAPGQVRDDAIALGKRAYELTEFLVRVAGVVDVGASFPHSVTYHASCHTTRELGIYKEPLELLAHVRGLELCPLTGERDCCGFGGVFSAKFGAVSVAMGDTKLANVDKTGAEFVTSVDPSCLMHLDGVIGATKRKVRPIYLGSILAQQEAAQ